MKNTYQNQRLVCVSAIGIIAIAFTAANIFSGITQAHRAVVADQQVSASSCALQTFSPVANLSAGTLPVAVAAADFNADGKVDFAVANFGSNNVSVYLNSGTGAFAAPVNYAVGNNPSSIVAADFNADGKMDLAVANTDTDDISILLGNGNGTFRPTPNISVGST